MKTEIKLFAAAAALAAISLALGYYILFPQVPKVWVAPSVPRAGNGTSTISGATSTTELVSSPKKELNFSSPYPLTWQDSGINFSLTGAALYSDNLALRIRVKMPNKSLCVPINILRLVDEAGNFAPPITKEFSFPDSGSCNGTAGTTYENQEVAFGIRLDETPFTFTTGGTSNIFFFVHVSNKGEISIENAPTSE